MGRNVHIHFPLAEPDHLNREPGNEKPPLDVVWSTPEALDQKIVFSTGSLPH